MKITDYGNDDKNIEALERGARLAAIEELAEVTALAEHPIIKFIKDRPFEIPSLRLPASRYKLESFLSEIPYMEWTLPLQDHSIPKRNGCGIFFNSNEVPPMKACSLNKEHYARLMAYHCGSLACVICSNHSALLRGAKSEHRLLSLFDINVRKGDGGKMPRHFVISPPQTWASRMVALPETYKSMYRSAVKILKQNGLHSGCIIFHPWREYDDHSGWYISPHFHVLAYGFVPRSKDVYDDLKLPGVIPASDEDDGERWSLIDIHHKAGTHLRSVRHTITYLLTHCGLNSFPTWDMDIGFCDILDEMIINETEDIEKIDLEGILMKNMKGKYHAVNWYGDMRNCNIRVLDTYKDRRICTCSNCESDIYIYRGVTDKSPVPAEYVYESKVRVLAEDFDYVKNILDKHKDDLHREGYSIIDFAMKVPECSCPETLGEEHRPSEPHEVLKQRRNSDRKILYLPYQGGLQPRSFGKDEIEQMKKDGIFNDLFVPECEQDIRRYLRQSQVHALRPPKDGTDVAEPSGPA